MEEQFKAGLLGSECGQQPLSHFFKHLNWGGDMSLAVACTFLLLPSPTLNSALLFWSLSVMRVVFGPKVGVLCLLAGAAMLSRVMLDYRFVRRCHPMTPLTACKGNLKNIATACEMYSTDYAGLYPHSLEQLTPQYLKALPNCPGAKCDSYSQGFRTQAQPDAFTICCYGINHESSGINKPNYPRYGNVQGLIER